MLNNQPIRETDINSLKKLAQTLRKDVLKMVMASREGHLGAAFSCIEILTALYFNVLNIDPLQPDWEDRDRFIMSKGHGCFAQYAVLARRGFYPVELLESINQKDTLFGGHPDRDKVPGIDVSTGSLGHGLSIGAGMALADKRDGKASRVFVLLGDGECQEGSVWEAAMFAAGNGLDNLTVIVDANSLQAIGKTDDIIPMEPFSSKWKSFGWEVREIDGHDYSEILSAFNNTLSTPSVPTAIIARTVKGKGVSYMENEIMWHARAVTENEYKQAVLELNEGTSF
jgi:transketolase